MLAVESLSHGWNYKLKPRLEPCFAALQLGDSHAFQNFCKFICLCAAMQISR